MCKVEAYSELIDGGLYVEYSAVGNTPPLF